MMPWLPLSMGNEADAIDLSRNQTAAGALTPIASPPFDYAVDYVLSTSLQKVVSNDRHSTNNVRVERQSLTNCHAVASAESCDGILLQNSAQGAATANHNNVNLYEPPGSPMQLRSNEHCHKTDNACTPISHKGHEDDHNYSIISQIKAAADEAVEEVVAQLCNNQHLNDAINLQIELVADEFVNNVYSQLCSKEQEIGKRSKSNLHEGQDKNHNSDVTTSDIKSLTKIPTTTIPAMSHEPEFGSLSRLQPSTTRVEKSGWWTAEEHRIFLSGLQMYGKSGKKWRKIAALIETRTVVQVRTHAQKHSKKWTLAKAGQNGKRGKFCGCVVFSDSSV